MFKGETLIYIYIYMTKLDMLHYNMNTMSFIFTRLTGRYVFTKIGIVFGFIVRNMFV